MTYVLSITESVFASTFPAVAAASDDDDIIFVLECLSGSSLCDLDHNDCLDDKREDYQNSSVLYKVPQLLCTCEQLQMTISLGLTFVLFFFSTITSPVCVNFLCYRLLCIFEYMYSLLVKFGYSTNAIDCLERHRL